MPIFIAQRKICLALSEYDQWPFLSLTWNISCSWLNNSSFFLICKKPRASRASEPWSDGGAGGESKEQAHQLQPTLIRWSPTNLMILFCWPQTSQNFCQAPSQRPWHSQQGWDPISRHHLFPTKPSCRPICFISSFGHLQGLMMNHANQSVSSLQLLLY